MRIIIVGPPRTGNLWLKCLLANIYGLTILKKIPPDERGLAEKINAGWFLDDSIFHQHLQPSAVFLELADAVDANLVTILRNPYDAFVSLYFFIQNFPKKFGLEHHLNPLLNKPIDHPDVFTFLQDKNLGYRVYLELARDWQKSNKTVVTHYEKLQENPQKELKKVTGKIKKVNTDPIKTAIEQCSLREMRRQGLKKPKHLRKGKVGDHQNYLSQQHYDIFRSEFGDLIRDLGYEVL